MDVAGLGVLDESHFHVNENTAHTHCIPDPNGRGNRGASG
jgi:hypothetical protein